MKVSFGSTVYIRTGEDKYSDVILSKNHGDVEAQIRKTLKGRNNAEIGTFVRGAAKPIERLLNDRYDMTVVFRPDFESQKLYIDCKGVYTDSSTIRDGFWTYITSAKKLSKDIKNAVELFREQILWKKR